MDEQASTRVVLIRHGESASNAGAWISSQDTCGGLTPLGVAQAEALRDRLTDDPLLRPDVVLVSTMARAVQTAEIAAQSTGLVPEQRAELMERIPGEAEGMTVPDYTERYGKAPWENWQEPMSPGGESGEEFRQRVVTATDNVLNDHRGKTVWVVCHGGVIIVNAIERWSGGTPDIEALPIASPVNSSISEWVVDAQDRWSLARYNDYTHLVGIDVHASSVAPPI